MSFQNKEFIKELLTRSEQRDSEVREVKRLGEYFKETDIARTAKEAVHSADLKDLRSRFSTFFVKRVEV